jgi:hypothetical protein
MTKSETITIVVYPSGADADSLTVSDAMQQVLDAFALLAKAEAQKAGSKKIVWRLEHASTNSPLTISAMAVASDPIGTISEEAHLAKMALGSGLSDILYGRDRASWIDQEAETIVRRILKRNLNGVGRTDVRFDDETPSVVIDHRSALNGVSFLEMKAAEDAAAKDDLTRTEYGSVEGNVILVGSYYNKPAFLLRHRLSGRDVWCVLNPQNADAVGGIHSWKEAWGGGQRVLVRGGLHYNSCGDLIKVNAEDVQELKHDAGELGSSELREGSFVRGFSPVKYLERLWGNPDA